MTCYTIYNSKFGKKLYYVYCYESMSYLYCKYQKRGKNQTLVWFCMLTY